MSESPRVFVLEVEGGRALPSTLRWLAGVRVEPISVGTQGQWFIVGPGVHAVHGYLAFDGATLYVQSSDPRHPLLLDGAPVGDQWQAVPAPARVAMGGVVIAFSASDASDDKTQVLPETDRQPAALDEDRTRYDPVAVREAMPTRVDEPDFDDGELTRRHPAPLADVPFADGDATRVDMDATRVDTSAPVQSPVAEGMPQTIPEAFPVPRAPLVRPAAGMPAPPGAGAPVPSVVVAQPPPNAPVGPAGAVIVDVPPRPPPAPTVKTRREQATELWAQFRVQWKQASIAKKATVALLPVAFFAVYALFSDNGTQAQQHRRAATHPSASAAASAAPQASAPATVAPPPSVPATQAPPPSTAPAQASVPAPPTARKAPEPPANAKHAASAPPEPPPPPGGKTQERLAVDAVVAGAYADAAGRYEALAHEHPDKPVYAEAARILRSKLDAGAP